MKTIKRITALMLTVLIAVSDTNLIKMNAATAKATTLRLEQTEGTVSLKNANGTAKSFKAGMKLYNGDNVTTDKSSYAYISLDSTKAVKTDENSSVTIKQNGTQNEVMVDSGSLIFNVTVPLEKKETLNIRTSTMVTGVRGTIGFAKKISEEESEIYILEGKVELTSINSSTGKAGSVFIAAGEKGICRRVDAEFDKKGNTQVPEVIPEKFAEENIPDYAVIEIGRNLDIQNRLRKDEVFDVDKILKRYRELGDKGTYITIGTVVTPNSVSGNAVSANIVSQNKISDESSGGSGGGGSGGGGGGAGGGGNAATEAAAPVIKTASVTGSGHYTYGDPMTDLILDVSVQGTGAQTTYQWYVADDETSEGTAVDGATESKLTPPTVAGTKYYFCVVTSKLRSDETKSSQKESNRVAVIIDKLPNTQLTEDLKEPDYENVGFTSITLDEASIKLAKTESPAAGRTSGENRIKLTGANKITLTGKHIDGENPQVVRVDTPIINLPGDIVTPNAVEYAITGENDPVPGNDAEWQSSRTFTGLSMDTTYIFYARVAATESTEAGAPGKPISLKTKKADGYFGKTVDNLEYMFDLTGYDGTVSANAVVRSVEMVGTGNKLPTDVEIPASIQFCDIEVKVTEIGSNAFHQFHDTEKYINPQKVTLPDTIEIIADNAFNTTVIQSINIPDSVKEIGERAFYNCDSLTSIDIGDGCESIGNNAFASCVGLAEVKIGDSVKEIESSTFYNCDALTDITFGEGVSVIGMDAFYSCDKLTDVTLGKNVKVIKSEAFYSCDKLKKVEFNANLEIIEKEAFCGCELTTVKLNKGLKYIGSGAFSDCNMEEIIIPSTVIGVSGDSISDSPFSNCNADMAIYCAGGSKKSRPVGGVVQQPDGWGANWNKISGSNYFPTYWYEEDPDDPTKVTVYSPDATVEIDDGTGSATSSAATDFTLETNGKYLYTNCISSRFLEKMFSMYDTVIVPQNNLVLLDGDLTIPATDTLDIKGAMSTENVINYKNYANMRYPNNYDENLPRGVLTNEGKLLVEGRVHTAGARINCVLTSTGNDIGFSSTIKSTGKIEVTGVMLVLFSYLDTSSAVYALDPAKPAEELDISDMTLKGTGSLCVYGEQYSGDYFKELTRQSSDFAAGNNADTGVNGMKCNATNTAVAFEFTATDQAAGTDSFGITHTLYQDDNSHNNYKVQLKDKDGNNVKVLYDVEKDS